MKRRVAIVCGALKIGGAEKMITELVLNLDREKYNVCLFCLGREQSSNLEKQIKKAGIKLVFCNIEGKVTLKKLMAFSKILSKFKPEVIHTHISGAVYSLPYIVSHKVKHIHTLHTKPELEFSKSVSMIMSILYKSKRSKLVTVSKENCVLAKKAFGQNCDITFVNNGINIERYYKKDHTVFSFINVGRQDSNKNQIMIIDAFSKLFKHYSDIKLYLVGDGNQHDNLVRKVASLDLQKAIVFPGMVDNGEDFLAISDVYIQSSHVEGLPLSVVEAMAAYLPIISTSVGGLTDIIKDNGILIPDNSTEDLYNAMEYLYKNQEKCKTMGVISRNISEDYSSKKMAAFYSDLYLH